MLFLLSFLLLVPVALSSPYVKIRESPVSVPLAVHLNLTKFKNILEADQKRAQSIIQAAKERENRKSVGFNAAAAPAGGVAVTNAAVTYMASVEVGSPATKFNLVVDTGSSNTWVGATTPYQKTSTSTQTPDSVSVSYGSGSFSGKEFIDKVALSPGLTIQKQSIGVADTSTGFQGVDGILGIGPTDLTAGTLSPSGATIPTVTDNLHSQGTIPSNQIGISFEPTTSQSVTNGQLTFGGTDSSKFTGSIKFVPITKTSPSSQFWGIDQKLRYGTSTTILSGNAGIVDTGTTLVLLTTPAFNKYKKATGGTLDPTTGLLKLSPSRFSKLKSLFFVVGGTTFELTANAQIWPRALNTVIGGTPNSIYLIVGDLGVSTGLDFINGFTFLERFYSVYDTANKRVGLATTPFTHAKTN